MHQTQKIRGVFEKLPIEFGTQRTNIKIVH